MVARFTGAGLGLLAFAVTVIAGLIARNPVTVTLSRGILALFLFFMIGLVLGLVAQYVINEHETAREARIREKYKDDETPSATDRPGTQADPSAPQDSSGSWAEQPGVVQSA